MKSTTVNLFLDKRASRDGEGMVKWLILHKGKQRLFSTGLKLNEVDWLFLKKYKMGLPSQLKNDRRRGLWNMLYGTYYQEEYSDFTVESYLYRAKRVIGHLGDQFTFERFAFSINTSGSSEGVRVGDCAKTDVIASLREKAGRMDREERVGNATFYKTAARSLARFVESLDSRQKQELLITVNDASNTDSTRAAKLNFGDLTPEVLRAYEKWMLKYGKGPRSVGGIATGATLTMVGINCRHIRSVFNDAIASGIISRDTYPFGINKYVIPAGANVKQALNKEDVLKLVNYESAEGVEQRSLDLWAFSYLCNGMNFNDVCRLKWEDINHDKLTFIRQKTARTRRGNQYPIRVTLFPKTMEIIEHWGSQSKEPKNYIFPFLAAGMSAETEKKVIRQIVKITNKYVNQVAKKLDIRPVVNTYSARHSFATILLQSEAPIAFISQSLGHTSISTTESYLGSFDDEKTKKYLSALL